MGISIEDLSKHANDLQIAADELTTRYKKLSSLSEAVIWKSDANAFQNLLASFTTELLHAQDEEKTALIEEENARKNLPFIKKFTTSREAENKHKDNIETLQNGINSFVVAKSTFKELIDETPSIKTELKERINTLNTRKKELTLEKRAVNEGMREIRAAARQARVNVAGLRRGTLGSVGTYARANITQNAQRNLSPLDSQKSEIETELIEIEGKLNRLKAINLDEVSYPEIKILRCLYCGRRVNKGELCPGCGSDKTTYELENTKPLQ